MKSVNLSLMIKNSYIKRTYNYAYEWVKHFFIDKIKSGVKQLLLSQVFYFIWYIHDVNKVGIRIIILCLEILKDDL